ncbi:ATP-binding protein [Sphingomonas sp. CJ99]
MRQVFTLWPTDVDASGQGLDKDGIPLWAHRIGATPPPVRWTSGDWALTAIVIILVLALALIVPVDLVSALAAVVLVFLSIGLAISGLVYHRRKVTALTRQLDEVRRWNDTLFNRTGIALWREDWSAARDEVLRLLRSGVRDMQAHYAAHPEQLRALRAKVIIKDVNEFAVMRSGARNKDDLIGSLDRILPDTDQTFVQWLIAFARGDSFYRSETHLTNSNGESVNTLFTAGLPVDLKGFEDILVSDLDITEYKATQARLAQAEIDLARAARAATMGALSASIAHEVNSPLAAIIANAEGCLRWLDREQPNLTEAVTGLRNVVESATRAKAVVERTRAYLSNSPAALTPCTIVDLIQEAILLAERELRVLGASVHIDARDGLPQVLADPVNIQQVLVNLILNAAQAMKDKRGPRDVTIAAWVDRDRIRVDVADKGPGIDPEAMKLIFDPFFSTREGGMGMGLSICRTCIGAHGGRLWASSSVGEGTTFHFDLAVAGQRDHG